MLRRYLGVVGCVLMIPCWVALWTAPARADDDASWRGKRIMMTKPDVKMEVYDKKQERYVVVGTVTDAIVKVEAVKADFLWVRSGSSEGWIDKSDAVLLENAIPFYTRRIRSD